MLEDSGPAWFDTHDMQKVNYVGVKALELKALGVAISVISVDGAGLAVAIFITIVITNSAEITVNFDGHDDIAVALYLRVKVLRNVNLQWGIIA